VVTLITWRLASQSDAAWGQFGCIHEAEMFLIKDLLEHLARGVAARTRGAEVVSNDNDPAR
jgi:hypothetical protein